MSNNFVGMGGGAVWMFNSNVQTSGQMTVQQNMALQGAFLVSSNSVLICDGISMFINNSASLAGAVSVSFDSQMFLSGVKFENNHADYGGGAVTSDRSRMIIMDSLMVNNSAGIVGGAIALNGSSLLLMGQHGTTKWGDRCTVGVDIDATERTSDLRDSGSCRRRSSVWCLF